MASRHATAQPPPPPEVHALSLAELERVLESPEFRQSDRSRHLLRYLVERSLEGDAEALKERQIGISVFGLKAGYDTNDNPIVRVWANELRKRLAKYSQHSPTAPVRLEIPRGGYRVEFHLPPVADVAPVVEPAPPVRRRGWLAWTAAGLLIAAALVGFIGGRRWWPTAALDDFWRPALESGPAIILCPGHPVVYRFSREFLQRNMPGAELDHFKWQTEVFPLAAGQALRGSDIVPISNQYVGLGTAEALARINGFLERHHKESDFRFGNDLSFAELRKAPAVLIGAYQNRWTVEFMRDLRFTFISTGGQQVVRDTQTGKTWTVPHIQQNGQTDEDYVLISRVLKSTSGEFVLAAAGITQYGGHTIAEVLTRPKLLQEAAQSHLRRGWQNRNLQLLYHVKVIGGTAGPPELVAAHEW